MSYVDREQIDESQHINCAPRTDHLAEIEAEGFNQVDSFFLVMDEEKLCMNSDLNFCSSNCQVPSVYAWVACSSESNEVIYIGMASQGWCVRRKQHSRGLKALTGAGAKNRVGLMASLKAGKVIKVLERKAEAVTLFGVRVPMHGAEEWALIARFKPPLNTSSHIKRAVEFAQK